MIDDCSQTCVVVAHFVGCELSVLLYILAAIGRRTLACASTQTADLLGTFGTIPSMYEREPRTSSLPIARTHQRRSTTHRHHEHGHQMSTQEKHMFVLMRFHKKRWHDFVFLCMRAIADVTHTQTRILKGQNFTLTLYLFMVFAFPDEVWNISLGDAVLQETMCAFIAAQQRTL